MVFTDGSKPGYFRFSVGNGIAYVSRHIGVIEKTGVKDKVGVGNDYGQGKTRLGESGVVIPAVEVIIFFFGIVGREDGVSGQALIESILLSVRHVSHGIGSEEILSENRHRCGHVGQPVGKPSSFIPGFFGDGRHFGNGKIAPVRNVFIGNNAVCVESYGDQLRSPFGIKDAVLFGNDFNVHFGREGAVIIPAVENVTVADGSGEVETFRGDGYFDRGQAFAAVGFERNGYSFGETSRKDDCSRHNQYYQSKQ